MAWYWSVDRLLPEPTGELIQYKDAILPVKEFPLWREDDLTRVLSPQWDFLNWQGGIFILNHGPRFVIPYWVTKPQSVHYSDVIMSMKASQTPASRLFTQPFYFRHRSKKTSKLRVTGLCVGNHRWPVNSPHKRPVTRKIFPFDDVIMGVLQQETHTVTNRWLLNYNWIRFENW